MWGKRENLIRKLRQYSSIIQSRWGMSKRGAMTSIGPSREVNRCHTIEFPGKDCMNVRLEATRTIWEGTDLK